MAKARGIKGAAAAKATPPRRASGRLLSSSATKRETGKKSVYFDGDESDASKDDHDTKDNDSGSGYEDESSAEASPSSSAHSSSDEAPAASSSDEAVRSRKRKRGVKEQENDRGRKAVRADKELWRPGVKTDLAPGEEVVIKLPRARSAGDTEYTDDTIHPNTLLFLGDLKRHNDRAWLKAHDADFRQAQRDFAGFADATTQRLMERDETLPELPAKDIVFRIYRDVRFSNDPTPYKTHFSAAWSRTGRKGPYAAYYLQVAPSSCFIGGGLWCPEAAPLALLRADVDNNPTGLTTILNDNNIRSSFLNGAKPDKHAIKAFAAQNASNALKRHPKGYDESHPRIELLRLRNYTIGRKLKDDEVLGPGGLERVISLLGTLEPFITYLNSVVMPDPAAGDDDDDDSDESDDD